MSELLILQEIMERIQVQERREEVPLPCDYFDLIGGTGTGGSVVAVIVMSSLLCTHTGLFSSLIALMLGRLGMPVDKAVRCYGTLVGTVFSNMKQTWGDGRFKASQLEKVIKEIVKEQTGQEDERMVGTPPHNRGCKTWAVYDHSPCYQADRFQFCPCHVGSELERQNPSPFPHLSGPEVHRSQLYDMGGRSRDVRLALIFQAHRYRWRIICRRRYGLQQPCSAGAPRGRTHVS